MFFEKPSALPEVKCYNPAFDVTDHSLITAIVTEKGICYPPFEDSFAKVFGKGGPMIPYPTDAQAKADILAAGRKIYQRGWWPPTTATSPSGGENALWVTPTGVCKGDMTEDMLVKMTLDGTVLEGTRKPSSEAKMHLRIYQENPTVRAVVHAHPPVATTFGAAGIPWTSRCSRRRWSTGHRAGGPLALPGSQGVANQRSPLLPGLPGPAAGIPRRRHLGHQHGEQAHYRLECLEQVATVTLHLHTLGCHRVIPPDVVAELEGLRPAWGILPGKIHLPFLARGGKKRNFYLRKR